MKRVKAKKVKQASQDQVQMSKEREKWWIHNKRNSSRSSSERDKKKREPTSNIGCENSRLRDRRKVRGKQVDPVLKLIQWKLSRSRR